MIKRKFTTKLDIFKGRPDMTAMIDVVLLLLIFFMLSSSFVQISGIKINLPETRAESESFVAKYIITVDRRNQIFFNDMPRTPEQIASDLEALKKSAMESAVGKKLAPDKFTIIIRSDKNAPYGTAVKLMSIAISRNFNVYVATLPEDMEEKDFDDSGE